MLAKAADPEQKRFKDNKYPWHACPTWNKCYQKLLDPDDKILYMLGFEVRTKQPAFSNCPVVLTEEEA